MNARTVLLIMSAAIAPTTASAAVVLDQQQNSDTTNIASFHQTDLAQSFTTTANNVAGGGVFLENGVGSGGGTVTFGLWTELPNVGGAVELATATATIVSNDQWLDAFWSPVSVTPGATYYLTFDSASSYGVGGDITNPYPNGNVFANAGYQSFPAFDYAFRTYTSAGAVPEPSTWAMMALGFAGLAFAGHPRVRKHQLAPARHRPTPTGFRRGRLRAALSVSGTRIRIVRPCVPWIASLRSR